MEPNHHLPILGSENCDSCVTNDGLTDGSGQSYGCQERKTVLTAREEEVLKRLMELGPKAKLVKEQIKLLEEGGSKDSEAWQRAMEELENLRQLRSDLDAERIAAAEERMRLLGHA